MLQDIVTKGSTDRSVTVKILDSTDGTPETGVVFNTSGIALWYRREGAALVAITEATLAALTTAHADGGFLHVSDGVYRLDLPDAAFATGANYVDFGGTVTGMVVIGGRVRLVDYSLEDSVRMGLTALPNAAAEAAGGLYTRGTGAGQINQPANGMIDSNVVRNAGTAITASAGRQEVNVSHFGGTAGTFASGRAEVNLTHIAGSAVSTTTAQLGVNVVQISGDATAADNLESAADGTGFNLGGGAVVAASVTGNVGGNVTGSVGTVNALAANVITAAATAADFTTEVTSGLATAAALDAVDNFLDTEIADIQARLPAALISGRIDATVGAMQANVMTAAAAAADLTTELQSGLATAAALATVDGIVDALLVTSNKLDNTLENTSDGYIFSVNGLQNAPSGSGASPSAIADEVQTRTIAAVTIVNGLAANVITAAATSADFTTEIQAGLATASALATVDSVVDSILVDTAEIGTAGAGLTALPWNASWDAEVQSEVADALAVYDPPTNAEMVARTLATADYATATALATVDTVVDSILADTGTDGVVVAAASKTGYRLSSTGVDDVLRTALNEGYAADGSEFTLEQALYMLWSLLAERSIATTTLTTKQLNGSTDAMTFTLDDPDAPTSQTRAT